MVSIISTAHMPSPQGPSQGLQHGTSEIQGSIFFNYNFNDHDEDNTVPEAATYTSGPENDPESSIK